MRARQAGLVRAAARLRPARRAAARAGLRLLAAGHGLRCAASPWCGAVHGRVPLAAGLAQLRKEGLDLPLRLGERALDRRASGQDEASASPAAIAVASPATGSAPAARSNSSWRAFTVGGRSPRTSSSRAIWRSASRRLLCSRLRSATAGRTVIRPMLRDLDRERIDDPERPIGLVERLAVDAHPLAAPPARARSATSLAAACSAARPSSRWRIACARRCRPRRWLSACIERRLQALDLAACSPARALGRGGRLGRIGLDRGRRLTLGSGCGQRLAQGPAPRLLGLGLLELGALAP